MKLLDVRCTFLYLRITVLEITHVEVDLDGVVFLRKFLVVFSFGCIENISKNYFLKISNTNKFSTGYIN